MNATESAASTLDVTMLDSCGVILPDELLDEESLLLHMALTGDVQAVAMIHTKYRCAIYAYVMCRVSDPMLADDIASEVLTRFIETLKRSGRQPQQLRSWLFGVAHKVVTDYYRRKSRRMILSLDQAHLDDLDGLSDTPMDIFERSMRQQALRDAFGELTQPQKDVLSLRFGAALSLDECAKILNRSIGAVKVLQFRGLRRLRALLESWEN